MNSITQQFVRFMPERKMELIGGKYVVGNWLQGSRLMLAAILADWGAESAVALAPLELWRKALRVAYQIPATATTDTEFLKLAEPGYSAPALLYGGSHRGVEENQFLSRLWIDFYDAVDKKNCGKCIGRDFTLRIDENGISPYGIFVSRKNLDKLKDYYVEDIADIVIEVIPITDTAPSQEVADELLACWHARLEFYAKAGISECWVVDTQNKCITFKRLVADQYKNVSLGSEGKYCSPSLPGLIFNPAIIWQEKLSGKNPPIGASFEIDLGADNLAVSGKDENVGSIKRDKGIVWDELPFCPRIGLEPEKLIFPEFISWAPQSKFEYYGDPPLIHIDSTSGTRNVLAMLLMTFGAVEAVKLLPPRQWIDALANAEQAIREEAKQKAEWWEIAQQAVKMLRKDYGAERIGVIGDLVRPTPLTIWSNIVLITWNMERRLDMAGHEIYEKLKHAKARIDIVDAKYARPSYPRAIANEMVEI
jgi:hypothetical protein